MRAKINVVSVMAFQCWETGHGMFDHPAVLAGTIRVAIAISADPMPRRSAAVEGDLFTALPTETGSPLAAWNLAGVELAAGV